MVIEELTFLIIQNIWEINSACQDVYFLAAIIGKMWSQSSFKPSRSGSFSFLGFCFIFQQQPLSQSILNSFLPSSVLTYKETTDSGSRALGAIKKHERHNIINMLEFTILIIFIALVFDFLNGMNDAANSIATIVATRVLSPRLAVMWAASFNFAAAFFFGVHVATTIGKGIVNPAVVNHELILSALLGAILWTHICTQYGFPISVSHSLIGGLAGSAVAKAGFGALLASGLIKVGIFIFLSPLIGLFLGYTFMLIATGIVRNKPPSKVGKAFKIGQLISSAAFSLGHGANDAQKTMGIIAILLYSGGYLGPEFYVPFWVVIAAYATIAAGTLYGGWKVVKTMGIRLTHLQPIGGCCAETAGAAVLIATSMSGIPVSTTHTVAGGIMGVGATRRLSAVRWKLAGKIVWAWVLTIPVSGFVGYSTFMIIDFFYQMF